MQVLFRRTVAIQFGLVIQQWLLQEPAESDISILWVEKSLKNTACPLFLVKLDQLQLRNEKKMTTEKQISHFFVCEVWEYLKWQAIRDE